MTKFGIINEFLVFLWQGKKFWLIPIVVLLLLFGAIIVFAQGNALAPFIYTLF